ncbi:MAG: imm11 family protein [Propylenella sp.]
MVKRQVPFLWIIPPRYPDRMVGIYDRKRAPHYLRFQAGQRLDTIEKPVIVFDESDVEELRKYDCLGINALIPLIGPRLAELILEIGSDDIQLVDARAIARDGELSDYRLVNVTRQVDCVDRERSLIKNMVTAPDAILTFDRLVLKGGCMGERAFARECEMLSLLLVSEPARDRLLTEKMRGLYFATADEFYPPRGLAAKGSSSRH